MNTIESNQTLFWQDFRKARQLQQQPGLFGQKGQSCYPLVAVQTRGDRRPLFFFCSDGLRGAPLLICARLVRHLPANQPFYGVKGPNASEERAPFASVEQRATAYLKAICAIQAEGPYFLAGDCRGGLIAFAAAQQLVSQGKTVGLLVLMDTWNPSSRTKGGGQSTGMTMVRPNIIRRVIYHITELTKKRGRDRAAYFRRKVRHLASFARLRYARYDSTMLRFQPQPYHGRLVLIASEERYSKSPTSGWDEIASALEVHRVPGHHNNYLGECIQATSRVLNACLTATNVPIVHQ